MRKLLCYIGIHRPLKWIGFAFTDIISHKTVWYGECPCGKEYLTNGNSWFGFRIKKGQMLFKK